ncbi:MAG: hypothetical protein IJF37_10270 [Lachnospiraceae bacterium]|nr:hypothetical protein [Lachnospiraceae bacterium]
MEGKKKWTFDISEIKKIIKSISIDKWILIGAAGIVLVLCSDSCNGSGATNDDTGNNAGAKMLSGQQEESTITENISYETYVNDMDAYTQNLEKELESILSSVDGAGKVRVMITLKNTSTKEVLMEEPYSESNVTEHDGDGGSRDSNEKSQDYHVIYKESSDGTMIPFVVSEISPQVEGVAVVAEGGDSAVVKEKITGIIKALFGIEINKIAVGKMK